MRGGNVERNRETDERKKGGAETGREIRGDRVRDL